MEYLTATYPALQSSHMFTEQCLIFTSVLQSFLVVNQLSCVSSPGCPLITLVSATVSSVELPVVEKLQLTELTESSVEEQDESVDEDELQKFKELKHKMMLLDKAELGSKAQSDRNLTPRLLSLTKR